MTGALLLLATVTSCGSSPKQSDLARAIATPQQPGTIELVASRTGLGAPFGMIVGPGRRPHSERLYASFVYGGIGFEVVAFDPDTGQSSIIPNPTPHELGARAMTLGPNGNLFIGTIPSAHLLELDTANGKLLDRGRPSESEQFIWDLTLGTDGKVYGGTDPNAKLVRYDPATGELSDLGRMDPEERFARHVAASDDGFIYVGIGASATNVAAYEIRTGMHREILPPEARGPGIADVFRATDGHVYVQAGASYFVARGWELSPIPIGSVGARPGLNHTADGRSIDLDRAEVVVRTASGSVTRRRSDYHGARQGVFRLGLGPDDRIYASTAMPAQLLRLDESARKLDELAQLGDGEIYSFARIADRVVMAGYATNAPLLLYDPTRAVNSLNPMSVHFRDDDAGWRPMALIASGSDTIYTGAIAGYGKLEGPLCTWSPAAGTVQTAFPSPHQSISTLAIWNDRLVVGTSVIGGDGSHTQTTAARIVIWDQRTGHADASLELPGVARVDNLAVAGGLVFAIASHTMYAIDPVGLRVIREIGLPFAGLTLWSSLQLAGDHKLWGVSSDAIFAIDPANLSVRVMALPPEPITAGFALRDRSLFFASAANVYRYRLP